MAMMPRFNKKAANIVWKIIGKPMNMQYKASKEQELINARLAFEETQRAR